LRGFDFSIENTELVESMGDGEAARFLEKRLAACEAIAGLVALPVKVAYTYMYK
jgi:hypothetical protein